MKIPQKSNEIIGEYPIDSLTEYVRNAKKIMSEFSWTRLSLNFFNFFKIKEHSIPPNTPSSVLIINRIKNEFMIESTDHKVKAELSKEKFFIMRYKTMHTASLRTPSPKRIENNLGWSSSFINVSAATVSVDAITEEKRRICFRFKLNGENKFILFEM